MMTKNAVLFRGSARARGKFSANGVLCKGPVQREKVVKVNVVLEYVVVE